MPESAQRIDPEFELIQDIVGFQHDPLGFVMYAFPWGTGELAKHDGPDEWQREILDLIGKGFISMQQAVQTSSRPWGASYREKAW